MAPNSDYDPEPFVKNGIIVKTCRECGLDSPIAEYRTDHVDGSDVLSDTCVSCREDLGEGYDLATEISQSRYGTRVSEGYRELARFNDFEPEGFGPGELEDL